MRKRSPPCHGGGGGRAYPRAFPNAGLWSRRDGGTRQFPSRNPDVPRPLSPWAVCPRMVRPFLHSLPVKEGECIPILRPLLVKAKHGIRRYGGNSAHCRLILLPSSGIVAASSKSGRLPKEVWMRRKFLVLEMFGLAIGVSGRNFTTRQAAVT